MILMQKKLLKIFIDIILIAISFLVVVAFFAWWEIIYNNTLIPFFYLLLIGLLICIPIFYGFYRKGNDLLDNRAIAPVIFVLGVFLSCYLFLSINYITIGKPIVKEFKLLSSYHKIVRKKRQYIKIEWKQRTMKLRLLQVGYEDLEHKNKVILETKVGLLGFDIIKGKSF